MPRRGSGRCVPRSNGATTCFRPTSRACLRGSPCSPAAAPWTRPRPSAAPTSTPCSHSSTRASSATRKGASGCWRRSASSRSSDSRKPAAPMSCGSGTAPSSSSLQSWQAPSCWPGARRSGSTGSKRSTTTSAPSSAMRSNTDAPTSHCGSAPRSGTSGGFVATGARAVAGSIRRLQPAGRATHSFASSHSGAPVCLPSGRGTSIGAAPWPRRCSHLHRREIQSGRGHCTWRDGSPCARRPRSGGRALRGVGTPGARAGDTGIVTIAVNNLGTIAFYREDYERALELFEEALAINREGHDRHLVALALFEYRHHEVDARRPRARARAAARRSGGGA